MIQHDRKRVKISHRIAVDLWGVRGERQVKTVTKHVNMGLATKAV